MSEVEPEPAIGDNRDWSFTAFGRCDECGYDPGAVADADLPESLRATVPRWRDVLSRSDVRDRPGPGIWSPLEYACHIRDVHRLFTERVGMMLDRDDPQFAGWDQDVAAVHGRYGAQSPDIVTEEIAAATEGAASRYDAVPADAWPRTGRRSSGGVFTISSMGHYHLHDVLHHLRDVNG